MNWSDDGGDFPNDITFGMQYFSGSDFSKYSKKKIPTFAGILRNSEYNECDELGRGFWGAAFNSQGWKGREETSASSDMVPVQWDSPA